MKYPTMRFVFDRKHVATRNKKGLVQIEVTSEGKRKWIGTSVKLYADQWNEKKKVVNSVHSIQLNAMLDGMMSKLNDFILDLFRNDQQFDFEKLNAFLEKSNHSDSFIDFVRTRIEDRTDIEESTRKQHRTLLQSLEKFGRLNYMDDLTKANITLYDEFLHQQEISQPTIYNYHKRLKRYLHEAMKFGLLNEDPYVGLHFERGRFEKRKYLTEEELKMIRTCKINMPSIDRIRDLFLFQCYTGLAYADFEKFNFEKDVEERNGKYIVSDRRKKTNEDYKIVLLTPAIEILKKYDYKLPIISNQKYNVSLKVVAQYAGIDKNITTHMGRHTFAVFALNNGVPIEIVAKMLGHTNIRTTQVYAKVLNSEVEKGFDLLESKIRL
ncbi:site-specific integrase [Phocaeicola massiliensis]|jgi:site-specific recombinase XerD|uniref:site-specific integrase n=1 Tax=Phocaeicola massiliensis TaxID=204516 RepID=UPI0032EDFBEF